MFGYESNCLHEGPGTVSRMPSEGGLYKGLYLVFIQASKKTMENSKWLGQQAWPGIEPGTSYLKALRTEPLSHKLECLNFMISGNNF